MTFHLKKYKYEAFYLLDYICHIGFIKKPNKKNPDNLEFYVKKVPEQKN